MKYTKKEQLDGVKFYHKSNKSLVYTISMVSNNLQLSWNNGTSVSNGYSFETILNFIDKKDWIVVEENVDYEIY